MKWREISRYRGLRRGQNLLSETRRYARRHRQWWTCVLLVPMMLLSATAAPEVEVVGFTKDEFGSGGILEMVVKNVEPGSVLGIEENEELDGSWVEMEMAPQLAEQPDVLMSVHVSDEKFKDFFRVTCRPPKVVQKEGALVLTDAVTLDEVIAALNRNEGRQFSLRNPYDPDNIQDPSRPGIPKIPAGEYRLGNAEDISEALGLEGIQLWESPPAKDDGDLADRLYPPTEKDQTSQDEPRELPGDNGDGRIDDGWKGDNITVLPEGGEEVEPGKFDMVFENPELPGDNKGDLRPNPDEVFGKHLRLRCAFRRTGDPEPGMVVPAEIVPVEVFEQQTGNGFLSAFPPVPNTNDYVVAVLGKDGVPVQITAVCDPLQVRVYNSDDEKTGLNRLFPQRGSHTGQIQDLTSILCTVPLEFGDPNDDLPGLRLSLFRLADRFPGSENILTPDVLLQYRDTFQEVASLDGKEILELLRETQVRQAKAAAEKDTLAKAVGTTAAATVTTLHRSGTNGSKWNVVIVAEGFNNSAGDQQQFNDYAEDVILDMFQRRDIHPEILNGINIFRINTFSQDSGVTQVNSSGNVTTSRRTALDYRYSGLWNRCWMESGPQTGALLNNIVNNLAPQADSIVVVLNEPGFGGCAGGNRVAVTRSASWRVVGHEFGHSPGGLADEYQCSQGADSCGCYAGGEPGASNLTTNINRNTLEWRRWVPAWRPIPTTGAHVSNTSQDSGVFAGGTIGQNQWWNCIYRPSWRGRMNNNSPPHNPLGYTQVRDRMRPYQEGDFRKNMTGDFNGDGRTDLVILDDHQISLYLAEDRDVGPDDPVRGSPPRGVTGVLDPTWYHTGKIENAAGTRSWQTRRGDKYYVGDFDNDGMDDIYVSNQTDWCCQYLGLLKSFGDHFEPVARYDDNLPGWQMRAGDEFYVTDFNGDGRDDLMVYNGTGWSIPYFGMLRSTAGGLAMSRRYDQFLPGWEMGKNEQFFVGDYNGDGRGEVIAFDPQSWAQVHFRVYRSNGGALALTDRYYGTVNPPGSGPTWQMRRRDKVYALDFNKDGTTDVAFFNGRDWGPVYLGLFSLNEAGDLQHERRYDTENNPVPGWQMQRRDRHWVADVDGDGDQDLVVYNKDNWSTQYLGMLRSNGDNRLTGSWQDDWIGSWNLGSGDNFKIADFRGSAGWDDLFVFNSGWFGLLRSYQNRYVMETIYRKWVHNHRYHEWGWW